MRFFAFITALALAAFTTAVPIDNNANIVTLDDKVNTSPASPLHAPRSCSSLSCILVTFDNHTQVNWNNVRCANAGRTVIGVLVGECYCVLYSQQGCQGDFQEIYPCPGIIGPDGFKFPVKSISCGGWAGGKA